MAVFTSQFKALAHGTLNWDSQLDADMGALETVLGSLDSRVGSASGALASDVVASRTTDGNIASGDFNQIRTPGAYRLNRPQADFTNAPNGFDSFATLVVIKGGFSLVQFAMGTNGGFFYRASYDQGQSWGQWWRVATNAA